MQKKTLKNTYKHAHTSTALTFKILFSNWKSYANALCPRECRSETILGNFYRKLFGEQLIGCTSKFYSCKYISQVLVKANTVVSVNHLRSGYVANVVSETLVLRSSLVKIIFLAFRNIVIVALPPSHHPVSHSTPLHLSNNVQQNKQLGKAHSPY